MFSWWSPVTVAASGLSLVLLIALSDVRLLIGVLIPDLAVCCPSWLQHAKRCAMFVAPLRLRCLAEPVEPRSVGAMHAVSSAEHR
jgi:hypothetical protein